MVVFDNVVVVVLVICSDLDLYLRPVMVVDVMMVVRFSVTVFGV